VDELPHIHKGETIEIYTLADERGLIYNHGFIDCTIVGPAVLGTNESIWISNRTTTRLEHAIYRLDPQQTTITGTLAMVRCSFERCLFHRIGFATHADQREEFRNSFVEEEAMAE
jgi:hypothetical protein